MKREQIAVLFVVGLGCFFLGAYARGIKHSMHITRADPDVYVDGRIEWDTPTPTPTPIDATWFTDAGILYSPICADNDDEAILRHLAESGEICKVLGHAWQFHPHLTLEYDPSLVGEEQCWICKKIRQRRLGDWEEN